MKKFKIDIDEQVVLTIQRLDFEVQAREFIVKSLMQSDIANYEIFKQYHSEYVDYFSQFEIAKSMITNKYIPNALKEHETSWNIDYASKTLEITQNCNCEVII